MGKNISGVIYPWTIFLGGTFHGTICLRDSDVGDKSSKGKFTLGAISRGVLSRGSYLWGNFPGAIIQGAIFPGGNCLGGGGGQFFSGAIALELSLNKNSIE